MIFDSIEAPIPALRQDVDLIPFEENGEQLVILRDPSGYGSEMLVFKPEVWGLLSLFDGFTSVKDIQQEIFKSTMVGITAEQILEIIRTLDQHFFLQSDRFARHRREEDERFTNETVRHCVHAGASYPEEPDELKAFMDGLFLRDQTEIPDKAPIGVICPHIDLRVGPSVYVPAFKALKKADFDTVIVLGTSHYSNDDLFILSHKQYRTELGALETDLELYNAFHEATGGQFTKIDTAHRQEHSIEFPVLFLNHLYDSGVKVLPILATSLESCIQENEQPMTVEKYRAFIEGMNKAVAKLGRKVAYVLSIDWSHIGIKFGDEEPAVNMLSNVRQSDYAQIEALERVDWEAFHSMLHANLNETKIDGYACISAFFDLVNPASGKLFKYEQWHEEERDSAVTYASMGFYKD
ncbi:MAG: AmmeMemoRadiSam system protein B [Ectothiorhodospiraceae bacterium]|nr:AmmeMemoRadiSam system protein B [Ectothiorhodospiraceae bacterium]